MLIIIFRKISCIFDEINIVPDISLFFSPFYFFVGFLLKRHKQSTALKIEYFTEFFVDEEPSMTLCLSTIMMQLILNSSAFKKALFLININLNYHCLVLIEPTCAIFNLENNLH